MTKSIRIENACNSNYKVNVEVWEQYSDGPRLVKTVTLNYPTALITEGIYSNRWLVIRENGSS